MGLASDFTKWRFWRHFVLKSFATGGVLATILQFLGFLFPKVEGLQGALPLMLIAVVSAIVGLWMAWPRPISQEYSTPNTKISIVKGDLLKQDEHLVVGMCDTFDTETPVIIERNSLQGQALQVLFGGDLKEFDKSLDAALASRTPLDSIAKSGKTARYPVGTVATVKQSGRCIFFLAYTQMNAQNEARASTDDIWRSLNSLWHEISLRGNGGRVSVPVIGGGQARISNVLPAHDAIRLTILSFMFASRKERVCSELRIVVRTNDYRKLDRLELQAFLASLRPS